MKTLTQIQSFLGLELEGGGRNFDNVVHQLTIDSRQVKAGDGFIALQGAQVHGLDFLISVLEQQPTLILTDKESKSAYSSGGYYGNQWQNLYRFLYGAALGCFGRKNRIDRYFGQRRVYARNSTDTG